MAVDSNVSRDGDPIRQEQPAAPTGPRGYRGAPFILFLTLANVAVFFGEVAMAGSMNALTAIPPDVIMRVGGNYASATLYEGRVESLVASCFVHWGILHLLFNMYAARQIGPALERAIGSGRMSVLYLGSGIVASMSSTLVGWLAQEQRLGAGASGAICGLIGATAVVGFRRDGWKSPLMRSMVTMLAVALLLGLAPGYNFDNAAHAGGAVAGALIAMLWRMAPERPRLRAIALAMSAATLLATAAAVVVKGSTDPFATLRLDERLLYAERALRARRCDEATGAVEAARRLAPRSGEVLGAVREVRARCGP